MFSFYFALPESMVYQSIYMYISKFGTNFMKFSKSPLLLYVNMAHRFALPL